MRLYLLLLIILCMFIYSKNKLIEPITNKNCCGGMSLERGDYKETFTEPPKKWRRCFKPYRWNSMPCTSRDSVDCCGGEGICRPTKFGGKCQSHDINDPVKFFIFDENGVKKPYTRDDELYDRRNYKADDEEQSEGEEEETTDSEDIFYIIVLIIVLLLGGAAVYNYYSKKKSVNVNLKPSNEFEYL